jgi:hypothetical protein
LPRSFFLSSQFDSESLGLDLQQFYLLLQGLELDAAHL